MSLPHSLTVWARRTFGWITSRQSWYEILSAVALLAGAGTLWWFRDELALGTNVLLWGVLLLAMAILFRQGWLKLFGPVLFYDMVRSGRRGRHILMRTLYAGFLLLVLWAVWRSPAYDYGSPTAQETAHLVQTVFEVVMAVQLAAVSILTPAYVAGAIADEKNRKTLEFLLATDLRSREIVLSKLGARLAQMALFVLTGLPILSLLQFLGGIDTQLVLAGFAATGLLLFGLGGISIFHSIYYRQPRNAIAVTYLSVLAYVALSVMALIWSSRPSVVAPTSVAASAWGLKDDFADAFWVRGDVAEDDDAADSPANVSPVRSGPSFFLTQVTNVLLDAFGSGNPFFAIAQVKTAIDGNRLDRDLPIVLGNFALFHGLLGTGCVLLAAYRLRPVAMR